MPELSFLRFSFFLAFIMEFSSGLTDGEFTKFDFKLGMKVKGEFVQSEMRKVPSVIECTGLCREAQGCQSISYNEDEDGQCLLSNYRINGIGNQERLISASAWKSLSKTSKLLTEGSHVKSTMVWSREECLPSWEEIGDACYKVVLGIKWNFTEAIRVCKAEGGKLAEPPTNASFELLRNYMVDNFSAYSYWIGLTDVAVETQFVWASNGEVAIYGAWVPGQPNGGRDDCVAVDQEGGYRWADRPCFYTYEPICEM